MKTDQIHRLLELAAAQLEQSATLEGLANADAIAKARAQLAEIDDLKPEDRRPVFSFEVNGQHVRWSGTLHQYHQDRRAYVSASTGKWETISTHRHHWKDADGTTTVFRATARPA